LWAKAEALANDLQYGLAAYLWTNDLSRAMRMTDDLQAGMIRVNSKNARDLPAPFGGIKASGIGRERGDCVRQGGAPDRSGALGPWFVPFRGAAELDDIALTTRRSACSSCATPK